MKCCNVCCTRGLYTHHFYMYKAHGPAHYVSELDGWQNIWTRAAAVCSMKKNNITSVSKDRQYINSTKKFLGMFFFLCSFHACLTAAIISLSIKHISFAYFLITESDKRMRLLTQTSWQHTLNHTSMTSIAAWAHRWAGGTCQDTPTSDCALAFAWYHDLSYPVWKWVKVIKMLERQRVVKRPNSIYMPHVISHLTALNFEQRMH